MNVSKLITPQQKIVAGFFLVALLAVLWFVLPPLVAIFKNLYLLAFYLVPIGVLLFFQNQIWDQLQIWSFNITKDMISKNPTFYLERGYYYITQQITEMRTYLLNSNAVIKETEKQVSNYINDIESNQRKYEQATDEAIKNIILAKIGTLQMAVDSMLPSIDAARLQRDGMERVLTNYSSDAEILRHKIDSLNTQYELLNQLSSLADKGRKIMSDTTPQAKQFKESIKLTERKVFEFTANIEGFQKEVLNYSQMKDLDTQENQQRGLDVIEKYKAQRLEIKL